MTYTERCKCMGWKGKGSGPLGLVGVLQRNGRVYALAGVIRDSEVGMDELGRFWEHKNQNQIMAKDNAKRLRLNWGKGK